MKVQEVILKAMAGSLKWSDAAEIIGISDRSLRRWRERYEEHGYDGLYDRRKQRPSPKRVPVKDVEKVLRLYREKYFDFNVQHFHEKLVAEHGIHLSYTWVKLALQGAGLVGKQKRRGKRRRRRPRRPSPGMLLHIDASKHAWFEDGRHYDHHFGRCHQRDLLCATGGGRGHPDADAGGAGSDRNPGCFLRLVQRPGEPFLCDAEGRRQGGSESVDAVGTALQELGIKIFRPIRPRRGGGMERSYRTWQGRLPQELRMRKIQMVEEANRFLREKYRAEFNRGFAVQAAEKGSAFVRTRRKDLEWVFSIQHERTVNGDNTIAVDNRVLQIEKTRWRNTLAGCKVMVYEHLKGTMLARFGPHEVARFAPHQLSAPQPMRRQAPRPLGHKRERAA